MSKIIGADKVIESILALADKDIETAMGKACALVERAAKQKAPKGRTGDLRKYISIRIEKDGENVIGVVYNTLEYAPYVEYGTGIHAEEGGRKDVPWGYEDEETGELIFTYGQHPQPHMRPALTENREEIMRILKGGDYK